MFLANFSMLLWNISGFLLRSFWRASLVRLRAVDRLKAKLGSWDVNGRGNSIKRSGRMRKFWMASFKKLISFLEYARRSSFLSSSADGSSVKESVRRDDC